MREILFRGKRIDNGEWVDGYFAFYPQGFSEEGKAEYIIRDTSKNEGKLYSVDPETICQYTGSISSILTGGKKIYEKDIVEIDAAIGIVKFGKYGNGFHFGYYIDWINSRYRQELGFWEGKVKVIGNIFDNPAIKSLIESAD